MQSFDSHLSRRRLLQAGAGLPLALSTPLLAKWPSANNGPRTQEPVPVQAKPDYVCNLEQKTIAPLGVPTNATLINGRLPGTEIRYREGDMFRVLVNNRLAVPCLYPITWMVYRV
jgi:FtsP/CotA-like multicopper oxidase with cupredoxin domain